MARRTVSIFIQAQVGLDPDGAADRLCLCLCAGLEFSALCCNPFSAVPATLYNLYTLHRDLMKSWHLKKGGSESERLNRFDSCSHM